MSSASKKDPVPVFQLKASVAGIRPPIWRRFLIRGDSTLPELHLALQCMMGWCNYHLHLFDIGGEQYEMKVPGEPMEYLDEKNVKLIKVLPAVGGKFRYEYDFGDSWLVTITVEKVMPAGEGPYPVCIKGKRAGPLEDSGGVYGYSEILYKLENPEHSEHEETVEWAGEGFDPEAFDIDEVNVCLAG